MPRKSVPNAKKPTKDLERLVLRHLATIYTHAHEIPDVQALKDYDQGELEDLGFTLGDIAHAAKEAEDIVETLAFRLEGKS